jgi:hypothetical protein
MTTHDKIKKIHSQTVVVMICIGILGYLGRMLLSFLIEKSSVVATNETFIFSVGLLLMAAIIVTMWNKQDNRIDQIEILKIAVVKRSDSQPQAEPKNVFPGHILDEVRPMLGRACEYLKSIYCIYHCTEFDQADPEKLVTDRVRCAVEELVAFLKIPELDHDQKTQLLKELELISEYRTMARTYLEKMVELHSQDEQSIYHDLRIGTVQRMFNAAGWPIV